MFDAILCNSAVRRDGQTDVREIYLLKKKISASSVEDDILGDRRVW